MSADAITKGDTGAYLPSPDSRCPTGRHVGALRLPLYSWMVARGEQFVCGCKDPRRTP